LKQSLYLVSGQWSWGNAERAKGSEINMNNFKSNLSILLAIGVLGVLAEQK
jgi:hypothetical protein